MQCKRMKFQTTVLLIISSTCIRSAHAQQDPSNITRAVNEEDVFIPCQSFEFRLTPPIWRINGIVYTTATLPSLFFQVPSGLFIRRVHRCLDGYTFQCIDTSGDGLVGRSSSIGTLTITSPIPCTMDILIEFEKNLATKVGIIELNHRKFEFRNNSSTLAWKIISGHNNCNFSQIRSYPARCQPNNNIQLMINTSSTTVTLPSEATWISGVPSFISISSLSIHPLTQCPILPETLQLHLNATETVQLLLGNNNCTCVEIACNGGLNFVATNPNSTLPDITCPANALSDKCLSIGRCANFNARRPFFHICENPLNNSRCSVCFGNITSELSDVKLLFYTLIRNNCGSQDSRPTRVYFRSFLLNTTSATVRIVFNKTTGEICFRSSLPVQKCGLSQSTHYNVSITDITENLIFKNNSVPESYCVRVNALQCGPFLVSAHPYTINNSVVYSSVNQMINTGNGNFCSCLRENVKITFQVGTLKSVTVDYTCSTLYLSQFAIEINITIDDNKVLEERVACAGGNFSVPLNDSCGSRVDVCGYWTFNFTSDSILVNCPLSNCTSMMIICPEPTISPMVIPKYAIALIVVGAIVVVMIIILLIIVVSCIVYRRCKTGRAPHSHNENEDGGNEIYR